MMLSWKDLIRSLMKRSVRRLFWLGVYKAGEFAVAIMRLPFMPPAVSKAKRAYLRKEREPRQVVFVCQHAPRAREAKLSYGLRSKGWKVVLLYNKETNWDVASYFDEVRRFRDEWEALSIASSYSPCAYHLFSMTVDKTSVAFIRHKPGKVVFDAIDWIARTDNLFLRRNLKRQRYCTENADGLCARDLQPKLVAGIFDYKLPKKLVFFPEYCWGLPQPSKALKKHDPEEIHVVLIGGFGIEKYGDSWGYLDIAEKLAAENIHFHIYNPWWSSVSQRDFQEAFSDYIELSKRTPFFHLHKPVPMDSVIPELTKYDIGIAVFRDLIYGSRSKLNASGHYADVILNSLSARIADYLDAGLPVISNKELRHQFSILSRCGAAIDGTKEFFENARERLKEYVRPEVKEKIKRSSAGYTIERNIGRLISFYESL